MLFGATKSAVKSVTLFCVLGRIYPLFASSVIYWKMLTDHVELKATERRKLGGENSRSQSS
jgi:hypothetical protein